MVADHKPHETRNEKGNRVAFETIHHGQPSPLTWRKPMRAKITGFTLWLIAVLLLAAGPVLAAEQEKRSGPSIDEKALSILRTMGDFLVKAGKFTVKVNATYDVVQESGQKVEFEEVMKYAISRPDRMRIDVQESDGNNRVVVFDGKNLSVYGERQNVYASTELPGTMDNAIVYFVRDLKMRMPMAMLFVSNVNEEFERRITSLVYVETNTIKDVPCDHLAGSTDTVDFQIWVAQGNEPLPRRVVLTYRDAEREPQFRARFSQWDFSPPFTDASFAFAPPEGMECLPLLALMETTMPRTPSAKKGVKK
jgi:hypothetical protein